MNRPRTEKPDLAAASATVAGLVPDVPRLRVAIKGVGESWERPPTRLERRAIGRGLTQAARRAAQRARKRRREEADARRDRAFELVRALSADGVGEDEARGMREELASIPEVADLVDDVVLLLLADIVEGVVREILLSPELRGACLTDPVADFSRERVLTLARLVRIMLCMGGGCLDEELWEACWREGPVPTASALTQRRRLPAEEGARYVFRRVTEECLAFAGDVPREGAPDLHGIEAFYAADATDVNVWPDASAEETRVGGEGERRGWNQYHLNCLYDVATETFVAAEPRPKRRTHETRALADMIRSMSFDRLTLVAGDRGYGSLNLIETVRRTDNLECLFRVRDNWIKEVARLAMEEIDEDLVVHVITTQRKCDKERVRANLAKYLSGASKFCKYKKSQVWDFESEVDVCFRVVRVRLGNGELETLVTTLPRDRFPPEVLRDLYHTRWRIENGFRVLKWQNHLAQMHCRIDGLSRQETWLKLASHNLVSAAVAAAEALHPHVGAPGAKYDTVPDRHHATVCVTSFLLSPHSRWDPPADGRECVTRSIASHRTQLRTGRTSPRRKRAIGHAPSHYRC